MARHRTKKHRTKKHRTKKHRTKKHRTRRHHTGKKKLILSKLRKAVSRVNKAARAAARTVEKPILNITKRGLGVVLKRRVGGRHRRGGSKVRSLGGSIFSSTAATIRSSTAKGGRRRKGGRTHRR